MARVPIEHHRTTGRTPSRIGARTGRNISRATLCAAAILGAIAFGASAQVRTAEEVQAFAERGAAHIRAVGRAQAFTDFTRPDGGFVDGELYIFCEQANGVVVADGGNPKLVGMNMLDVVGPERAVSSPAVNRLGATQRSGWTEVRWPNPVTKRIELKTLYVMRVDDATICGSGYYRGAPP